MIVIRFVGYFLIAIAILVGGTSYNGTAQEQSSPDYQAPTDEEKPPELPANDNVQAALPKEDPKLTIASWGGAYAKSQDIAYFTPFTKKTGIEIKYVTYSGGLNTLKQHITLSDGPWDVVDLDHHTVNQACELGLLERIDTLELSASPDGTPASNDFLPGSLHDCGVASVAWASSIVYDTRAFRKHKPRSVKDLFNLKKFPGKRALPKGPRYNLELALMSDGVPLDEIYELLATQIGITRALKKLDTIKRKIVWWSKSHESLELLAKKKVVMATSFNGRSFQAIAREGKPFEIIWDGQIYDLDFWAVPKGARYKDDAMAFIAFASRTDRLAEQTKWFPYGPMRKSALALVSTHAEAGIKMAPFIPTISKNFENALQFNGAWWEKHGTRLEKRFNHWLTGKDKDLVVDIVLPAKIEKPKPKKRKRRRRRKRRSR